MDNETQLPTHNKLKQPLCEAIGKVLKTNNSSKPNSGTKIHSRLNSCKLHTSILQCKLTSENIKDVLINQ